MMDDSDKNILAELQHEGCEAHCTECGCCDWRNTGPTSWKTVPIVGGLCPDCAHGYHDRLIELLQEDANGPQQD